MQSYKIELYNKNEPSGIYLQQRGGMFREFQNHSRNYGPDPLLHKSGNQNLLGSHLILKVVQTQIVVE